MRLEKEPIVFRGGPIDGQIGEVYRTIERFAIPVVPDDYLEYVLDPTLRPDGLPIAQIVYHRTRETDEMGLPVFVCEAD